jgi:hypothetical protein
VISREVKGYPKDEEKLRAYQVIGRVMASTCTAAYLTTTILCKTLTVASEKKNKEKD